ncbi:MAG TPA: 50S ribosomal protein L20 [Vicinamibacterales bacterium]|nr:50S ribosomal protein L20 [Vicinamibacterales bacterium]
MPRVKRGNVRRAKRKKLLSRAKGFYQTKSKLYRSAKESVDTALKYAFVGRRRKKRDFRRLWVMRINAAARENGLTYGQFMAGLKAAGNTLDRKSLSELAVSSPAAFASLAKTAAKAKPAVAKKPPTAAEKVARPKARAAAEAKA